MNKRLRPVSHTVGASERTSRLTFIKAISGISCQGCATEETEETYQEDVLLWKIESIVQEKVHLLGY